MPAVRTTLRFIFFRTVAFVTVFLQNRLDLLQEVDFVLGLRKRRREQEYQQRDSSHRGCLSRIFLVWKTVGLFDNDLRILWRGDPQIRAKLRRNRRAMLSVDDSGYVRFSPKCYVNEEVNNARFA